MNNASKPLIEIQSQFGHLGTPAVPARAARPFKSMARPWIVRSSASSNNRQENSWEPVAPACRTVPPRIG